jgi:Ca2+-binding EF-hand superfamily protein
MSWDKRKKIVVDRIMRCEYMKMIGPSWSKISPQAKRFVERMLQINPSSRPTAKEALLDLWIVKYQEYQPEHGMPAQDQQYANKLQIKQKVQLLIAEELKEDEIVQLKTTLVEHDPKKEDRITLEQMQNALLQAQLSPDKVKSIFSGQGLNLNEHVNYIGLLNDALDRKERLQEDLIMDVFNQCGTETTCTISKERLRDVLEKRGLTRATLDTILNAVDSAGDSTSVSCEQVVSYLKEQEMHRVNIICSCRKEGKVEEPTDDNSVNLVDETNTVIPGGRRESNAQPLFIYDDECKSIRKYRPEDDETAHSPS